MSAAFRPPAADEAVWLESLPEAVLVVRGGVVAYANRAARGLFDPPAERDLLGEPAARLLPPGCRDHAGTAQAVRLDGRPFPASVQSEPTTLDGQAALLHLVRNIEHEQALHQRLTQKRHELLVLSGRFISLQEQERRHIARELHDEIGQCLSAIRVQFAKLHRRVESPEALALIASAASMTERTLGSVRSLSLLLHPPQLDTLGLSAALRWHLDEQRKLHGLDIAFEAEPLDEPVPQDVAIAAYRIVQESLSNVLRHAAACQVTVSLRLQGRTLEVEVGDDGRGFDAENLRARIYTLPRLGLLSMTERARLLGGELNISSAPGQGTKIAARLPLPGHGDHDDAPRDIGG